MGKRRGGRKKKKAKAPEPAPEDPNNKVSKTLIFANGKVSRDLKDLIKDWRAMMEPYTAAKLQEKEKNTIKDFSAVAGTLGVTHLVSFTTTSRTSYMKVARYPRGPTLTFRLHQYALRSDVVKLQKNPHSPGMEYKCAPLVVLNNFNSEEQEVMLMGVMFQNLFPAINISTVKVIDCQRVVLFEYNKETKHVEMRHFLITVKPVGISKSMKQILSSKVPSLGEYDDISDYVMKGAGASESDVEDAAEGKVVLPDKHAGRLNLKQKQSAVRLTEIGPRVSLQLIKIEEEFFEGDVIFHEYIKKTPEEIQALKKYHEEKKREKERRKKQQEENYKRKRGLDEEDEDEAEPSDDDIDDIEYYRQEVGEEPDSELFARSGGDEGEGKKKKYNPLYRKKSKESSNDADKGGDSKGKKRQRDNAKDSKASSSKDKGSASKKKKTGERSEDWMPVNIPAKRLKALSKPKPKKKVDKKGGAEGGKGGGKGGADGGKKGVRFSKDSKGGDRGARGGSKGGKGGRGGKGGKGGKSGGGKNKGK